MRENRRFFPTPARRSKNENASKIGNVQETYCKHVIFLPRDRCQRVPKDAIVMVTAPRDASRLHVVIYCSLGYRSRLFGREKRGNLSIKIQAWRDACNGHFFPCAPERALSEPELDYVPSECLPIHRVLLVELTGLAPLQPAQAQGVVDVSNVYADAWGKLSESQKPPRVQCFFIFSIM